MTKEAKNLKDTVSAYHALELTLDDVSTMIELGNEENDASVIPDIEEYAENLGREFDNLKDQTLYLVDMIKIMQSYLHAGAGGRESCDWAGMLYQRYSKMGEDSHGFKTEVLDYLDGDEAGIKSITFEVNGEIAPDLNEVRKVYTNLAKFPHLMRQERDRLLLHPVMLCRILKKIYQ